MPEPLFGVVIFGDVIESRRASDRATAWLRHLAADLDEAYATERLARFAFTQGDELQGLLVTDADPFRAILRASLDTDAQPMRWSVAAGPIDPGSGPATERTGAAFVDARERWAATRARRDHIIARTGTPRDDSLLENLAPLLAVLLSDLSARQREVTRLLLVDGLRRSDVAATLGVSRATVSVLATRARAREIERLSIALGTIFHQGVADAIGAAR